MQTKDLHHSGAEKYHLDNDPECIKVIIFPFHRDEDDGCFTYRSMNQSNNKFFRLILPHLQRSQKYLISNERSFLSSDQYDLYTLVSHSQAFQASNIIDLMTNSERKARHEMYSGVIFKGDTTFHKGGGVVSTPRFSIQILLDIKSHG